MMDEGKKGEVEQEEEALLEFQAFLSRPESSAASLVWKKKSKHAETPAERGANHLRKQQQDDALLRKTCQVLFRRIEALGRMYHSASASESASASGCEGAGSRSGGFSLSGLEELYAGSTSVSGSSTGEPPVDSETLWGQVELQNAALQSIFKRSVKKLSKATASVSTSDQQDGEIRLLGDMMSDEDDDNGDDEREGDNTDSSDDEDRERMRSRMERAMEDADDGDVSDGEPEGNVKKGAVSERQQQEEDGESSKEDPAAAELNDGFFNIHEMEAFADEEEEYLPDEAYGNVRAEEEGDDDGKDDKRSFHQKQRDGDAGDEAGTEGDESDDEEEGGALLFRKDNIVRRKRYRGDDEIEALYSLYKKPRDDADDGDSDDVINMTAADIFGKPNKKYYERSTRKKAAGLAGKADGERKDDDSWNDYDFEDAREQQSAWNREGRSGSERDSDDDDDRVGSDADADAEEKEDEGDIRLRKDSSKAESSSGRHSRRSEKLLRETEQLEKDMLAEKPWQMTGETTSTSRPVNSLLEATPEFEVANKMAPIITVEHTEKLEDVIRRRILEEDWDDVIPRELPDVGWHTKRGEPPEVSQEKSKLGLGELYEREYLKKAVGYDADAAEKQTAEEKAKDEMRSLFANLCSKLDALSNYHFAPRPIAQEAEARPVTKPAIAMEEVLPLHVSGARAAAPEEVHGAKRGRDGILRGESELDQQDRKRLRSSKKAARRKARREKLADEKLVSRLQPGVGLNNPYEKRKMREELSAARAQGKVSTGQVDTNDYGASSGTFFKRMQQEAEHAVRKEETDPAARDEKGRAKKSSAFKL